MGFGVWGLGFGVWGLGFGVWGFEGLRSCLVAQGSLRVDQVAPQAGGHLGCNASAQPSVFLGLGIRVEGRLGFRVQGLGFRVEGFGFRDSLRLA